MRGGRAGQRTEIGRCTGTSTAHTGIFQAQAQTFGMESPGRISRGDCARSGRACKFPRPSGPESSRTNKHRTGEDSSFLNTRLSFFSFCGSSYRESSRSGEDESNCPVLSFVSFRFCYIFFNSQMLADRDSGAEIYRFSRYGEVPGPK